MERACEGDEVIAVWQVVVAMLGFEETFSIGGEIKIAVVDVII